MSKKKVQLAPSATAMRPRIERALREGKTQSALDLAKQLFRLEPTVENQGLLAACYLARAMQLTEQGARTDAATTLVVGAQYAGASPGVLVRFAEGLARCGELLKAVAILDQIPEPRPANRVLPLAADAALHHGLRDQLPESLRGDFDRVRNSFKQLESGAADAVRESLQGIGLSSPFLEWKVLLRGLLAYYQQDDARAIENWSRLDPARLPARLAAPIRLTIDRNFAAAQPPETQTLLRKQSDRLTSDTLLAGLRSVQTALVKAQGHLAPVFREIEAILPALRQRHPELVGRLARVMYWEIIDGGMPEDTARYLHAFGKPVDDPEFARMSALAMERESGVLGDAHEEWKRYDKTLATLPGLTEAERERARALVWQRMANNAARHANTVEAFHRLPFMPFGGPEKPRPLTPSAEKCLRRAIELAPDWLDPQVALVEELKTGGKRAEAVKAAEALVGRFPDHLPTLTLLARLHQEAGAFEKSAEMLERALAANPLDRVLRHELMASRRRIGTRFAAQGQIESARAVFEAALAVDPSLPSPLITGAWAACEFKAGNNERAEELLGRATAMAAGKPSLDGWMYAQAVNLKLPKATKERFEKPFKSVLDAASPTPQQVAPLLSLFVMLLIEDTDYHGAKTHRKKAIAQAERTVLQPYTEDLVMHNGLALMRLEASRALRTLSGKWMNEFPQSAWPPYFQMESFLTGSEHRWPIWRLKPLAERAKALAEKMPPSENRETLLKSLDKRLQQFADMNPFAHMLDELGDGPWEEDDPW